MSENAPVFHSQSEETQAMKAEVTTTFEIDEARTKLVGMKEWAMSQEEKPVLATKGLAPCIGIAAYDPTSKTGYMAHIAIPMFEQASINELFGAMQQNTPDMSALRVWVRGGQKKAAMTADFDMPQMGRDSITAQLSALGLAEGNLDISYDAAEMGSQGTTMLLDTETGEFKTKTTISEETAKLGELALS